MIRETFHHLKIKQTVSLLIVLVQTPVTIRAQHSYVKQMEEGSNWRLEQVSLEVTCSCRCGCSDEGRRWRWRQMKAGEMPGLLSSCLCHTTTTLGRGCKTDQHRCFSEEILKKNLFWYGSCEILCSAHHSRQLCRAVVPKLMAGPLWQYSKKEILAYVTCNLSFNKSRCPSAVALLFFKKKIYIWTVKQFIVYTVQQVQRRL